VELFGVISGSKITELVAFRQSQGEGSEDEFSQCLRVAYLMTEMYVEGIQTEFYGGEICGQTVPINTQGEKNIDKWETGYEKSANAKSIFNRGITNKDIKVEAQEQIVYEKPKLKKISIEMMDGSSVLKV
jgi:hypothetical protein